MFTLNQQIQYHLEQIQRLENLLKDPTNRAHDIIRQSIKEHSEALERKLNEKKNHSSKDSN